MFRKNVAGQFIHFQGVDSSTGGIKSGVTWTIRRCIDGTFAAATGTVTEDGTTGWYKFAMSQADTNGNNVGFNFTGTGAVPQTVNIITTALDPTSAAFGLSIAKTTNITGFNDIAATAIVSSGAITTSGGAVSTVTNTTQLNGASTVVLTDASSDAVMADAIWNAATATYGGAGSYGLLVETDLDAAISTRATPAQVNTEVDTALADVRLDELLAADSDIDGVAPPVVGSVFHELMTKTVGSFTYDQTTDALEAIRDNMSAGSGDWTATEKENIRHALGVDGTKTAPTLGYGRVGDTTAITDLATGVGAVKTKTDNLPTDPADESLLEAAIAAVQADTDNIQTRIPAALVSGRMDSSVGAVATDAISAAGVSAAAANKLADSTLRRTYANARASSDGDAVNFRSLLGAIGKLVNKWSISGTTLTVYQEDDLTSTAPGGTQTLTATVGADPITAIDTD